MRAHRLSSAQDITCACRPQMAPVTSARSAGAARRVRWCLSIRHASACSQDTLVLTALSPLASWPRPPPLPAPFGSGVRALNPGTILAVSGVPRRAGWVATLEENVSVRTVSGHGGGREPARHPHSRQRRGNVRQYLAGGAQRESAATAGNEQF